jgi:hypothetical protein
MDGVIYLSGGIIPCRPSEERVWLWRGSAAPSPPTKQRRPMVLRNWRTPVVQAPRAPTSNEVAPGGTANAPFSEGNQAFHTRDETRTRKTRRSGDFESPASTDSATRAHYRTECSGLGDIAQRMRGEPRAHLPTAVDAVPPAHPLPSAAGAASGGSRDAGAARPECRNTSLAAWES